MLALSKFISENSIKGFLAEEEGVALFEWSLSIFHLGPCLEIGSYCGKSSVYIGEACRQTNNTLYAVDHHRGSEEHQLGEEYHDTSLFDAKNACMDSFPAFRRTIMLRNLEDTVIPIVAKSASVCRHWAAPLGLVFVDGGHSHESAMADCINWSKKVASKGILAIHDIYPDEEHGGQGPRLAMEAVLGEGQFEKIEQIGSLVMLRKK